MKKQNIDKLSDALLDKPVAFRKNIVKQAAIKSGLITNSDNELFNKFWETYNEILLSQYRDCIIVG